MVKRKTKESKKETKIKVKSVKPAKKVKELSVTSKKPQKAHKNSKTMEELLKATGYKLQGLKKGEAVSGVITELNKTAMFVDIGAKVEGMVLSKELAKIKDFVSTLKVGDKITALVGQPENDKGQILLSLQRAAHDYQWEIFKNDKEAGKIISVRGLEVNKGGIIARLLGVNGFVPASQFSRQYLGKLVNLLNKTFKVKIIEVNREKNRLIFSEKQVSEAEILAKTSKLIKKVKEGEIYEGIVSGIMPFGVFVRVTIDEKKEDFLEGLVHISEISWEKVSDLNKLFKIGDKVKIKVIGVNREEGKLNLSIKKLEVDPWEKLVKGLKVGSKLKGEVNKLVSFGAFVNLSSGIDGLIHISKIPADFDIKVGDKIEVLVEEIDKENHRLALGLVLKEKPVGYK